MFSPFQHLFVVEELHTMTMKMDRDRASLRQQLQSSQSRSEELEAQLR